MLTVECKANMTFEGEFIPDIISAKWGLDAEASIRVFLRVLA